MAIHGFTRQQFEEALRQSLSPAAPIRSSEHLRGREKKQEDIRRALVQPGRSVFIYGDRGVGKTSLAQTVAFANQSSNRGPVILGCAPESTFSKLMLDVIRDLQG